MSGAPLPFTPRAMRADLAALYVGLSPSTFRQVVAPVVPAIRLTAGRVAWLREDLDAWLDRRKSRAIASLPVDAPAPAGDAAPLEASHGRDFVTAGLAHGAAKRRPRRPNQAR